MKDKSSLRVKCFLIENLTFRTQQKFSTCQFYWWWGYKHPDAGRKFIYQFQTEYS